MSKVLDTVIKLRLVTLLRGLKFCCWVGIIVAYISLYLPLVAKKENFKNTKVHSTPKELQVTRKLGLILKTSSDSCETPFKTFPLLLLWGVGCVEVPNSLISNKPLRIIHDFLTQTNIPVTWHIIFNFFDNKFQLSFLKNDVPYFWASQWMLDGAAFFFKTLLFERWPKAPRPQLPKYRYGSLSSSIPFITSEKPIYLKQFYI